ncbi:MAG: DUF4330 domain-containing protein [Coriobacteriia bacterium]|nr:DUF4330 domain-containing protein [Coriobacteriia bacterium]
MKRTLAALLVLVALTAAGCSRQEAVTSEETQDVELVILIRAAQPEIADSFEVGQQVRVKDTGTVLGEITEVTVEGSLAATPDAEGELHASRSPVLSDIRLTVRGEAVVSESGYRFGSQYVYVNNDIKYLTPFVQFSGILTRMQAVGE